MTERGREFVRRLSLVIVHPPRIRECERPKGPTRTLDDWRGDVVRSRRDIINKPGLYLDRSPTGTGKSTADIDAVRQVDRALIVVPTHENGQEVETDMQAAGINAMKYPARSTEGKEPNCQNRLADTAEQFGLSAVAAVCPTCDHRAECLWCGYLAELDAVKSATVAIATHARTVFNGFDKLAEGRGEFIAVHEDAANTICPDALVAEAIGIESLLLRASLESKAKFHESPWRLLLAAMTGELFALGVIVDESRNSK